VVYCVQIIHADGSKGPIKIGLSNSTGVKARLRTLQASCYEEFIVIGIVRGDFDYEVEIQRSLEAQRIRGEWYAWCEETEKIIKQIFA
jgi:hypothetical protein